MTKKRHWHLMSWKEIQEVQKENPVVLIPAGTVETQGPITFVGLEHVVPTKLAEDVASRTNSLVVPGIPYGYSQSFSDYPGTITLRPETVTAVYEDVVHSIIRHGFDHLLFLAMHVPNQPLMTHVAQKLREEKGILFGWINPGRLAPAILREISPNYDAARGHGADPGLSLAKYLEPDAINLDNVVPNEADFNFGNLPTQGMTPTFNDFPLNMGLRLQDVSPESGGWGDPSFASFEQGQEIYAKMVDHVSELVDEFSKLPTKI